MTKTFNIVAAALIVLLAVGLYRAKSEADLARARVEALQHEVDDARAQVKALSAESAFLQNPDRIEKLAGHELALKHAALSQHKALGDIDAVLPQPADQKDGARAKGAP